MKALTEWIEGKQCTVQIDDMIYKRVVRYKQSDGLYIVINNRKYFEYELDYSPLYEHKKRS